MRRRCRGYAVRCCIRYFAFEMIVFLDWWMIGLFDVRLWRSFGWVLGKSLDVMLCRSFGWMSCKLFCLMECCVGHPRKTWCRPFERIRLIMLAVWCFVRWAVGFFVMRAVWWFVMKTVRCSVTWTVWCSGWCLFMYAVGILRYIGRLSACWCCLHGLFWWSR